MPFRRESALVGWGSHYASCAMIGRAIYPYITSRLPAMLLSRRMGMPHFRGCSWFRRAGHRVSALCSPMFRLLLSGVSSRVVAPICLQLQASIPLYIPQDAEVSTTMKHELCSGHLVRSLKW
ncbi:hypothetical protein BR93DRAFT_330039 [Coniochaeta sp. PMI_546]|nr:hypothetical protein BR93DRAFT_330039 [Coniochaeta sp. PMI_546]